MSSLIQTRLSFISRDFSPKRHHNVVGQGLGNPMNLGSNSGSWTSYLVSLRHGFLLFETISEIYESSKWHIVGLLTQLFLNNILYCHPPRAKQGFSETFLKIQLEIMEPNGTSSHKKSVKKLSLPRLTRPTPTAVCNALPGSPGKAQDLCLMVQISHFALSRACKNEVLGGSGFSKSKAVSVILENIKMWKNFSSY